MKKALKILGLVIAVSVAFSAGLMWSDALELITEMSSPRVESDHRVRQRIKVLLPALPETAHHLYFATKGGLDPNDFFACSVPAAQFPALLAQVRELLRYSGSGHQHPNNDDPLAYGPDSWSDVPADPVWDLKTHSDLMIESTNRMTVMYSPSEHRVFVFAWSN
jgi:hypothetical protein